MHLFIKLDWSQPHLYVHMADPSFVQLLAFHFVSLTYAYQALAEGLNKSVTGCSALMRNYLDPCLAANLCTQYNNDFGCGADDLKSCNQTSKKSPHA